MGDKYDFSGVATQYGVRCADGVTIHRGAFAGMNGKKVPLVWNHQHGSVNNVLGHAILEENGDRVIAHCKFNRTDDGKHAHECLLNGDIEALSIYANKLTRKGSNVMHGIINEVSMVLAGCNPGALIDTATIAHSMGISDMDEIDELDEAYIYHDLGGDDIEIDEYDYEDDDDDLSHGEDDDEDDLAHSDDKKDDGEDQKSDDKKSDSKSSNKTAKEIYDTLNQEQKNLFDAMVAELSDDSSDDDDDDKEEDKEMAHNLFEDNYGMVSQGPVLTKEDRLQILKDAKKLGSLKEALKHHLNDEDGVLCHAYPHNEDGSEQTYGIADINWLFPEVRDVNPGAPEFIKRDQEWVAKFMNSTKHTPFSRIRTMFADITEDEARAKGYTKGKRKIEEVFTLLKRKTEPTTVYKKQKLDRDDIVDITGFDVVAWIWGEMRMMLNEEIARAALVGDGRSTASDDKINELNIRPIWTDDELFTIHVQLPHVANETEAQRAKRIITAIIRARKTYKGSGNPICFTTADEHTEMLLLEDGNGYSLYKTDSELAAKIRCREIVEVPVMEGLERTITEGGSSTDYELAAIVVNPADYNIGADKGGAIMNFEDFDIDFNQYKYLLETRCSGALVRPKSAIVIEIAQA